MKDYDNIGIRMEITNLISNCIVAFCLGFVICAVL